MRGALAAGILCLGLQAAEAAVPTMMNFQGRLTNPSGTPINNTVNFIFRIWDAPTSGAMLWTESQNAVVVSTGIYNVMLGAVTPLSVSVFNSANPVYLEVTANGEDLAPRLRLQSVAYAFVAPAEGIQPGTMGSGVVFTGTLGTGVVFPGTFGSGTMFVGDLGSGITVPPDAIEPGTFGSGITFTGTLGSGVVFPGTFGSGTMFVGELGTGITVPPDAIEPGTFGSGITFTGTLGSGVVFPGTFGSGTIFGGTLGTGVLGTGVVFTGSLGSGVVFPGTFGSGVLFIGDYYRKPPLRYTRGTLAYNASDATKDAQCASEFGGTYMAANLLENAMIHPGIIGSGVLGTGVLVTPSFNVRGNSIYSFIVGGSVGSTIMYGKVGSGIVTDTPGTYQVSCISLYAPVRFTSTLVDYTYADASKDGQCQTEFGPAYLAASILELIPLGGRLLGGDVATSDYSFNVGGNTAHSWQMYYSNSSIAAHLNMEGTTGGSYRVACIRY